MLVLLLLLLLPVYSLATVVASRSMLLRHLTSQVLYVLEVVQTRDTLHSSQELGVVLSICWHLLTVAVVGILLFVLVLSASVSVLIVGDPWRLSPSLAWAHLL